MKKDYKVYIKLFAIFLFVFLILQTIRLDGFQDLNNMVDSQGIVITSPSSVPMTTSQTVADPEVAAASEQAIASASAARAVTPPPVTAPVTPPPVTPPPVTAAVTPPPVTAPVTSPATNTITQATANASALAASASIGSTSTSNTQITPLAIDTAAIRTSTYILMGIITVGGIATATILINTE
jgi:hypothetical protein